MEEKTVEFGIEQTKEVLGFVMALGSTVEKTLKGDEKITMGEIPLFIPALIKLPAALEGVTEVPQELEHLDDDEKAQIYAYVKENFDIDDEKVEGAVVDGLKIAGDLHTFVKTYFFTE